MSSIESVNSSASAQQPRISSMLRSSFGELFGLDPDALDVRASFLELGADSLTLLRASQTIQEKFGVKIPFRLLLDEVASIEALSHYVAERMPADALPPEAPEAAPPVVVPAQVNVAPAALQVAEEFPGRRFDAELPPVEFDAAVSPLAFEEEGDGDGAGALERLLARQIQMMSEQMRQQTLIMSQQLELLRGSRPSAAEVGGPAARPAEQPARPASAEPPAKGPATATAHANGSRGKDATNDSNGQGRKIEPESFVPHQQIRKASAGGLNPRQQAHLDALIARVVKRTPGSKQLTQTHRTYLADSRTSAGFRHPWKEMCYPLVIESGKGSKVSDVDGNEYIDLTMGFGALLFGHSPDFMVDALQDAVGRGVRLGGQSHLVGETAKLICELTGVERVAFCNSGTEAVMGALRLARTVTGRTKIALFDGSYHGTFDGVMVKPAEKNGDGSFKAMPLAPGIPQHMIENVLLLGYDDEEALAVLRRHAHDLAAVLIEPPRSRRPDVQPREFLKELRKITAEAGAALIFDEVVTGFRFHPGGVQAMFGVEADIVCYGKALGGGVPVAAVAGKRKFMDAVDGGTWQYGDDSYPREETTFFAGTYFKNPLIVAAVHAAVGHIKESGPQLYAELNGRTSRLAATLNEYFKREQVPMQVAHLGSLMRFIYPAELKLMELFYYHLLEKGIYICETRNCFLSTAHTDADVDYIVRAVRETVEEMRDGGILPEKEPDGPGGGKPTNYQIKDPFGGLRDSFSKAEAATQTAASAASAAGSGALSASAEGLPLTEAQKQLWFLAQMGEEASVAYNLSMTLELRGPLDLAALGESLRAVVNNHEALRITFGPEGDRQFVAGSLDVELPLTDLSGVEEKLRERGTAQLLDEEARRAFDLAAGPLLRARVVRLGEEFHLLALTVHHIVSDGWSLGVIVRELSARYTAACGRVAAAVPEPMQFGEYVRWEARQREGSGMSEAERYWLGQFAAPPAPLDLPSPRARPAVQTYAGARATTTIDSETCERLERFGSQHGSTMFMLLLAGFNILMHRLSGQHDVVVGIPAAGQAAAGGSLVGYCVNVLPLRSRVADDVRFTDYLSSVKRTLLDAYDHQIYPFTSLVKKLNLPRDPSRPPLVTVMFNLDRAAGRPQFFGLEAGIRQNTTGTAQFDLDFNVTQTADGLHVECDFNTDIFDAETVRRWFGHFETILGGFVAEPARTLAQLPLLDEGERQQLLVGWNETRADFEVGRGMHHIFEARAAATPDAAAVRVDGGELSYGELNRRANRLARHLTRQGVGTDTVVALLAQRGAELLTSMLAVFKAGGAYLPLDPRHPPRRLAQVLTQSGASLVLATAEFAEPLAQAREEFGTTGACEVLEFEQLATLEERDENLSTPYLPRSLAYVIYTSGSTGIPKGAMIEHAGMLNHLFAKISDLSLTADDVVAQTASQCFDISVWQFLAPLVVGGCVHVFDDEAAADAPRLLEEAGRGGVTILETVPSLLRVAVSLESFRAPDGLTLDALRWLLVTGEALPPDVCALWLERFPAIPLLNAYGPTECSDDVTHHAVREAPPAGAAHTPIGRPVANTQIYITDARLEPVPVGVVGELYVGGAGVGRGYLKRPELTAEKFIPDPFSTEPGARLYRTGDLARYLPGGEIEFLGRVDHQVKVRGHRIELGEIEAALRQHEGVRETVVIAREDAPGDKRLVAYVVAEGETPAVGELRAHLKRSLPDYMTPSHFVTLEALPLTSNGKVDRKALPAPEGGDTGREYVAPRTPAEETLAGIWAEVLRVERVGAEDNFFELGGDSILSIQVVSKARKAGLQLTPAQIFQRQTVAELAQVAAPAVAAQEAAESALAENYQAKLDEQTRVRLAAELGRIEDVYPLSPTQQGMLFQHLYAPASTAYFEQVSWRLDGALDAGALKGAWERVVEQHPALRTCFVWDEADEPLQVVGGTPPLSFAEVDWRGLSESEQEQRLEEFLQSDRDRGFDLKTPPLRLTLIRLSEETHQFVWSYHHILLDGWAVMLVLGEVFKLYEALREGRAAELQPARPYRDYISWLRRQDLSAAEKFWRETLRGLSAPTPLGVGRVPGGEPAGAEEFAEQQLLLSRETTDVLLSLARQKQLTMSTLVQGVWSLLLSQYSGESDVVFGTVVSGRPPQVEGVETMVGLFINTLPTRVRVRPEATLLAWLKEVQEQQAEARQYDYSPLAQVQQWSDVPRGTPLFESILAYENYPVGTSVSAQRGSLRSRNVRALERVNYPLFVVAGPGAELSLSIYYDARVFDAATVTRMLDHFRGLLEGFAVAPERRVGELSLLTGEERQQVLVNWNQTAADYPKDACLHQLFEAQAAASPAATAVVFEGRATTYAELNRRANQLAHHLRGLGVGPDSLVGLCVERSAEMLVALLGVLKAGGAYVPLDPAYPRERLRFMLEDSGARVLLTERHLSGALPSDDVALVYVDGGETDAESDENLPVAVASDNLAYVIYTSGSTGTPKGVQIAHRAVVNFLQAMREQFEVKASDVLLAVTSLSFDIAGLELFLPLTTGATVNVVSRRDVSDGAALLAALRRSGATLMQATPTTWELLLNAGWRNEEGLKVLCGGEAFPRALATRLLEGDGAVWNLYGPTETTIWSTLQHLDDLSGAISIGRPINNTQVYITDAHLRPVPVGVPGFLYLGGDGLSRGYLNRPELTAERFIPDPFSTEPGARLYKTGDLARYLPDGRIEFLGRDDHQVKVRGFRIELGEIEAALTRYPGVRQAVVVAREGTPGEKRLAAYLVTDAEAGAPPSVNELRAHLKQLVPDYMTPSHFVVLEALPLTPNGKVDRKALPAPDAGATAAGREYVAPRTPAEQTLARVWAEVLHVERVGAEDNFFELGGDSILSIQVIAKARQAGLPLTAAQLFEHGTVAELARVAGGADVPAQERAEATGEIPLTPVQRWFFAQELPNPHHFNQAVLLEVPHDLDADAVRGAAEALLARHDALRLRFSRGGDGWTQHVAGAHGNVPFVVHDFSALPESEHRAAVERVAEEAQRSLDLDEGVLMRVALMRLGGGRRGRLSIVIHHLAVDISSWRILLEDFQAAYEQLALGEAVRLPPATSTFAEWARRLDLYARSSELEDEQQYWLDAASAESEPLPVDYDGENLEESAEAFSTLLDAEETRLLLHEAPRVFRALPSEMLLTALLRARAEWDGEESLTVDLEGHGREALFGDLDVSRTVGWFTSIYPLHLSAASAESVVETLRRVKEQARAVPRGGVGYGLLKYSGSRAETAARLHALPSAEVSFNYVGASAAARPADAPIAPAAESHGAVTAGGGLRPYPLMVTGQIEGGRLRMTWSYSRHLHRAKTVKQLAGWFDATLRELLAQCLSADVTYTPSDFPNANLNQLDLDQLIGTISAQAGGDASEL